MKDSTRRPVLLIAGVFLLFGLLVMGTIVTVFAFRQLNTRDNRSREHEFVFELTQIDADQRSPEQGVLIQHVNPDSPAAKADLVSGDIILKIDDQDVDSSSELIQAIGEHEAGDMIVLTVQSGQEKKDITVELASAGAYLGVEIGDDGAFLSGHGRMTGKHTEMFPDLNGLDDYWPELGGLDIPMLPHEAFPHQGEMPGFPKGFLEEFPDSFPVNPEDLRNQLMVWSVEPASPADKAGLQGGDIITEVNGEDILSRETIVELISAMSPGELVEIKIERDGENHTMKVTLESHPEEAERGYLGIYLAPGLHFRQQDFDYDSQRG